MDGNCLDLIRLQPMSLQHRHSLQGIPISIESKNRQFRQPCQVTLIARWPNRLSSLSPRRLCVGCGRRPQDVSDHYGLLHVFFVCSCWYYLVRLVFGTRPKLDLSVWQRSLKPFGVPNFGWSPNWRISLGDPDYETLLGQWGGPQ